MLRIRRAAAGQQYAIIVGLVGVVALAAIGQIGGGTGRLFTGVSDRLQSVTNEAAPAAGPAADHTCANGTVPLAKLVNAGGTRFYLCRGARSFNLPANAVTSCGGPATLNSGNRFLSPDGMTAYGALRFEYVNRTLADLAPVTTTVNWTQRGCSTAECSASGDSPASGPAGSTSSVNATVCGYSYDGYNLSAGVSHLFQGSPSVYKIQFLRLGNLATDNRTLPMISAYILRGQGSQSFVDIPSMAAEKAWVEQAP